MGRLLRAQDAYPAAAPSGWWNTWKVSIIASVIFFFWIIYGSTHFYRDPGSVFFDQDRAYERFYSAHREHEAFAYQDVVATAIENSTRGYRDTVRLRKAGSDPQLCVAFVTIARPGLQNQPIDLAVASALSSLTPVERSDVYMSVYFSHVFPDNHKSWRSTWLGTAVDEMIAPPDLLNDQERKIHESLEREKNYVYKASVDYARALEHCLETTAAPYIALFEDDTLFADGWASRSMLGLKKVERAMNLKQRPDDWLDLRIFVDERSIMYADRDLFGNHIPLISLCVGSVLLFGLQILRRRYRFFAHHLDNSAILVICVVCVPTFIALFYQSGKASLIPNMPGVYEEGSGCCGQAQIFRREAVPELAEFMRDRASSLPYDKAIWAFAHEKWWARWTHYPDMVQHVGSKSMLWPDRKDKDWSMAFETLDPRQLDIEHRKAVDELYGSGSWSADELL